MYRDNNDLMLELRKHIDSDESLLWVGKPKQGLVLKGSDGFMIPFSLMWGGFAVFWEYTAIKGGAPLLFALWGLPFVFIGLYMIFGRFFFDSARRDNTIYGITQNRIIIKTGVFKKSIKSLNIQTISDVTLNEKGNGSGTIILGPEPGFSGMFRGTGWPGANKTMAPSLEMIPDVRKVYRTITDLQRYK